MNKQNTRFVITAVLIFFSTVSLIFIRQTFKEYQSRQSAAKLEKSLEPGDMVYLPASEKSGSYLKITVTPSDIYQVEFTDNAGNCSRMIVSSKVWNARNSDGSVTVFQLIPAYILKKGFSQIRVIPLSGDDELCVYQAEIVPSEDAIGADNLIDFEIRQYEVEIGDKAYDKLIERRNIGLENGLMQHNDEELIPVKIRADGKTVGAQMRLKGDWTDHIKTEKWSMRFSLDGDQAFFGLHKFTLQAPFVRDYALEPVIYAMYRDYDGVAIGYEFSDVFVNGVYRGVYTVEESMGSHVLAASDKTEGPIVRLNKKNFWNRRINYMEQEPAEGQLIIPDAERSEPLYEDEIHNEVITFDTGSALNDPDMAVYTQYAVTL